MTTSEKKIMSNRANARRSTGPKTEHGKAVVRTNAITYGLFTEDVLISRGDGKEDADELAALVRGIHEYFEPVGTIEETLVTTIVQSLWRTRRVHRAEVGEARLRLDSFDRDRERRETDAVEHAVAALNGRSALDPFPLPESGMGSAHDHRSTLFRAAAGVRFVIALLRTGLAELSRAGELSWGTNRQLRIIFEERAPDLCALLPLYSECPDEDGDPDELVAERAEPELWRRTVRQLLQQQIRRLGAELIPFEHEEEMLGEARRAISALPDEKKVGKLSRMERQLETQRYVAIEQLERMQQRRRDRES